MLESLIRSKTTRKIITIFASNPDTRFYTRQLERLTNEPVSAVRRELQKLEKAGLFSSKDEARVKFYWINKDYPVFEEIRTLVLKMNAITDNRR